MGTKEFLKALANVGELTPLRHTPTEPPRSGTVNVFTDQGWHVLNLPAASADASASDKLDASRLSDAVLGPVLGIHDLRTDPHVQFVPGNKGVLELERMVVQGEVNVAFNLRPVSFSELKEVSDTGGCMPPKSTYIEPKLRSGLTVYSLEDS
jgi:uncharacterized protein (DUF1015 family)